MIYTYPSPPIPPRELAAAYLLAKVAIIEAGFEYEITWQEQRSLSNVTEQIFLRETAWVVLSSGMRESVVRKCFPDIENAFRHWRSTIWIKKNSSKCIAQALRSFHHKRKINALVTIATIVSVTGLKGLLEALEVSGPKALEILPYIGPITSWHLAKNLGLDVSKPDRHLQRIALVAGYKSPSLLCQHISHLVGDPISVVDLVIWRFATLHPNYIEQFFSKNIKIRK